MTQRFGNFELDENARQLRLNGVEILLQPRVFDLLVVLYLNRQRVVSKDELMDRLWPGVVVGEGSLQRAVSLARSALKQGGFGSSIRNYSRQGYRFCFEDQEPDRISLTKEEPITLARAAFARGDWDTSLDAFQQADARSELGTEDLERMADAYHCAGRVSESEPILERTIVTASVKEDSRAAGRAALRLAEISFESGRAPVAQGWLSRGRQYLMKCETGWEHGFEAYVSARMAIGSGDSANAVEHGQRCVQLGREIGSEEIEALGKVYLGYGEIALGNFRTGTALVDEAAAIVLSGNVSPRAGGIIYCGLIWLCCNRGDWQRAAQWSDSFERWCEREGMTRFTGLCQLHRAEVLSITGNLNSAERELLIACDQLDHYSPFASGDAYRILGELHYMRGDLDQAGQAFKQAHSFGWDPQPGLALLQAEMGDPASAMRGLRRSLDDGNWALQQRRGLLLAALVIIAATHGDNSCAEEFMVELENHPELWASDFTNGAVARARAELATSTGRLREGISAMREAIGSWRAAGAELNQALCRFRLAQLLAAEGDVTAAVLELDVAESSFERLGAAGRSRQCAEFRHSIG